MRRTTHAQLPARLQPLVCPTLPLWVTPTTRTAVEGGRRYLQRTPQGTNVYAYRKHHGKRQWVLYRTY